MWIVKYHALFVIFEKAAKFEIVICCKLYVALYGLQSADAKISVNDRNNNECTILLYLFMGLLFSVYC